MKQAWESWFETLYNCFVLRGLKQSKEQFSTIADGFFSEREPNTSFKGSTVFERRISRISKRVELSLTDEDLKEIASKCVSSWQKFVRIDSKAYEVLSWLNKRVPLALVSNFDHPPHIRTELTRYKLIEFFQVITISSEVGVKKPDPEIFSDALKALKLSPSKVIYVGDSEEDVISALGAGIKPVLIYRRGWNEKERILDFSPELTSLEDKVFKKYEENLTIISDLDDILSLFHI